MSENENDGPKARKLTSEDLPEMAEDEAGPRDTYYCRFFKQTMTGWEEIKCSSDYSSENDCARFAGYAGADGYTWTGKSC